MRLGPLGLPEILLILLVVLLIFGPKRLPEMAKGLGQSVREFRRGIKDMKEDFEHEVSKDDAKGATAYKAAAAPAATATPTVAQAPTASSAEQATVTPTATAAATATPTVSQTPTASAAEQATVAPTPTVATPAPVASAAEDGRA